MPTLISHLLSFLKYLIILSITYHISLSNFSIPTPLLPLHLFAFKLCKCFRKWISEIYFAICLCILLLLIACKFSKLQVAMMLKWHAAKERQIVAAAAWLLAHMLAHKQTHKATYCLCTCGWSSMPSMPHICCKLWQMLLFKFFCCCCWCCSFIRISSATSATN